MERSDRQAKEAWIRDQLKLVGGNSTSGGIERKPGNHEVARRYLITVDVVRFSDMTAREVSPELIASGSGSSNVNRIIRTQLELQETLSRSYDYRNVVHSGGLRLTSDKAIKGYAT